MPARHDMEGKLFRSSDLRQGSMGQLLRWDVHLVHHIPFFAGPDLGALIKVRIFSMEVKVVREGRSRGILPLPFGFFERTQLMSESEKTFRRSGQPGGPGCSVTAMPVKGKDAEGNLYAAELWDAGKEATELELLRTVIHHLGVRWGHDDLGWWAAVPMPKVEPKVS